MWISLARTACAAPFIFFFLPHGVFHSMSDPKAVLRREAILHRARIDRGAENPESACALFFEAIAPAPGQIVAAYWPHGTEFSSLDILDELLRRGQPCALPAIREGGDRELDFLAWDESVVLQKGPLGIMQPPRDDKARRLDPDIVIVPLLAFDRKGHRLGYGKGYYDATLSALRRKKPALLAVGLAFAQQAVLFNLPREDHDVPLDWVVTPQGAQRFGDGRSGR